MKTPTIVVTVSLTAAIVVLATLVIATGTRGQSASFQFPAGQPAGK